MAPIRIGFIGLSKTGWAQQAHLPYLKQATDKYKIVALQNSSVERAREAIKFHDLSEDEVRAYGSSEDLAADPNVDLVVCSVRVDRHAQTITPSLKAGKHVFVEWPLGKSLSDAEEILHHHHQSATTNPKQKTFVDLQAREAPVVLTVREFIASGKLGKVLSTTWHGYGGFVGGDRLVEGFEFLGDKSVGGNLVTVVGGHTLDYVQQALGSTFTSASALKTTTRRFVKVVNSSSGTVTNAQYPQTSDDVLFLHGFLNPPSTTPSNSFVQNVPISYVLRGGPPFKDTPDLDWRILGEKGELRITSSNSMLQIGRDDTKIEFHSHLNGGEVSEVKLTAEGIGAAVGWDFAKTEALPLQARNVARVYEDIASSILGGGIESESVSSRLCTFVDAVERHRFLESL
ncbi:NAD-binding Rossmann fold oxidoreductase family protein [Xylariaceae sp. FL0594]|nr:NAD-binding Rossmann fold oxidoreductase family protein [Xylariaceae sp. FL0594]